MEESGCTRLKDGEEGVTNVIMIMSFWVFRWVGGAWRGVVPGIHTDAFRHAWRRCLESTFYDFMVLDCFDPQKSPNV